MKTLLKSEKGFTLMEVMITLAILSVVCIGVLKMFTSGIHMWNYGLSRLELLAEANYTMSTVTKIIQDSAGGSITISRLDNTEPVNSYFSSLLAEPLFIEAGGGGGGCGRWANAYTMTGTSGNPMQIYQQVNKLIVVDSGGNSDTVSTHINSLLFTFSNSQAGTTVIVGATFAQAPFTGQTPVNIFMQKTVVIKHLSNSGFYQQNY